jgi:hypothetical protein
MLERKGLVCAALALASALATACSGSRDVEVSGSVSAPAGEAVSSPITLDFRDVVNDTDAPKSVLTATLDAPGDFTQTVSVSGDKVRVRALVDANGDGTCSAGELWAETDAPIGDGDKVDPVSLTLARTTCPSD